MNLHVIHTGMFKLDGGAMFGVVPKTIWSKTNPADDKNLCDIAMRCLLVEDGNRLILIDCGIGDKQSGKFFSYYYLHGDHSLKESLGKAGFSPDDVTDVFLTHLHFDHCGGGVVWKDRENKVPGMYFRNATYWSNTGQWNWAVNPNPREKASFLPENILPIAESGQLKMIDTPSPGQIPGLEILFMDGHTDKQMLPVIKYKKYTLVFMADLLPTAGHIPLPYVMSYDTRPLITMEEKKKFLNDAAEKNYILFFEHDPLHECCNVRFTEKGIRADEFFELKDL
jgi:glyoxylase-like metal-dependent hydrolase (beta-lactamase superfamily II)